MPDSKEYEFRMQVAGESVFPVLRFGWDPKSFHDDPSVGAQSDSLTASFLGRRYSLQHLCSMIESQKTMLFLKLSDLVTIGLHDAFLRKKTLDHVFFTVKELANGRRTPGFVTSLFMKDVSIVNLKARQSFGLWQVDWVTLQANEVSAKPDF